MKALCFCCFKVDDWCLAFTGDSLDLTEFIQAVKSVAKEPEIEEVEVTRQSQPVVGKL